jgi:phosphatidylserine/phosphatidylglycerophosphate/cardiolipin synthase-like enzyme
MTIIWLKYVTKRWLEIAEYVSLVAATIGSVAAFVSQQIVLATAPLTLSLWLNLLNRQRFQQGTKKYVSGAIADVQKVITSLHGNFHALPSVDLNPINERLDELAASLDDRSELEEIQAAIAQIPPASELEKMIASQLEASIADWTTQINQQLALIQPFEYQLVINRSGSRAVLMEALEKAQERLILVCPWLGYGTDAEIINKIESLLKRQIEVWIGWGMQRDFNQAKQIRTSIREQLASRSDYYIALPKLEELEQQYPHQLRLKLLGTHEKYLVCDHSFAMLGSHNFLASGGRDSEREVGIRTNDPRLITNLIERFEVAADLEF